MDKDKYLTVGEAAKELGINKNTLLYYDREGVIISLEMKIIIGIIILIK